MLKCFVSLLISMFWLFSGAIADNNDLKIVNRVIGSVSSKYAPDKRTAMFEVVPEEMSKEIILKGKTNLPEAKKMVLDSLSLLEISFRDSIIVLPEQSMGDKIWGLATLSVSNMRAKPDDAAELVSQVLMGTPMKVLDYIEGWYKVQTPDNYIGWMGEKELQRINEAGLELWKKSDRYIFTRINGNAFNSVKRKRTVISDLVFGNILVVKGASKGFYQVQFPDGRMGFVKKKDCISWKDWTDEKLDINAVIHVTFQMMGVAYLWGGASTKAMDCSGLTKIAYFSQGIILARDASQQARYGHHPDFTDHKNLQSGDLLFFGRNAQRVTHVGIYLGNDEYINASGYVRINSLDPKDPRFKLTEKKNLVGASRILNSLNTEGIVLVKDHPWYVKVNHQ